MHEGTTINVPTCMKLTVEKGRHNSEIDFCTYKSFIYVKRAIII